MNTKSRIFLSIPMLAVLSILSSCQITPALSHMPDFAQGQVHTILFSSNDNHNKERAYYDALLELQKKYPDKLSSIKIIQKDNTDMVDYFKVSTFPTLIIMYGNKVSVRIEGQKDTDKITEAIEPVYEQ
ncbi:thioredoxin domain-containing protein [Alkalihalobacillus sp. AL-G]|uniref:thioredoxin domain-containing protein n=1 Tax=Alkalihalobacillus sp. AL-G TaxID=2926399 RepID=UPI00272C4763|nr:thioredoxin domain-containing protein [Alkalihalobacillus sp. AL-G]WLD95002.1 thioredoxin domain-containing protein [Alkalihalobacillus sp. AL-G]